MERLLLIVCCMTLRDEEGNFATHGSGKLRVDQIPTAIADEGYEQESASWVNKKPTIDYEKVVVTIIKMKMI